MESTDDDPLPIWLKIIVLVILTFTNSFFSLSEIATLYCNRMKMKKLASNKNKTAKLVLKYMDHETRFIGVVQIGVTLAGFLASGFAATSFSEDLGTKFNAWFNISWGGKLSFILITIFLSYLNLVFGELFPKRIALRFPNQCALIVAWPIAFFKILFMPIVYILSVSTEFLVWITRLEKIKKPVELPEEEIINIMDSGSVSGTMPTDEQKMIEGVFKLDNLNARDVMTPRVDVSMVEVDESITKIVHDKELIRHTRIPVYKDSKDNIIGVLNLKDLLGVNSKTTHIGKIMRKPIFITDTIKINELYRLMQEEKTHIAIINDEFGGFEGIVTLEDIIEEVLGNIVDEYDVEEKDIVAIKENHFKVLGSTPIQDVNRIIDLELPEDDPDYDTIGGFVITKLERVPKPLEKLTIPQAEIIVKKIDINTIEELEIIKLNSNDQL